ncbi:hypothetical protein C0995_011419 [Termitomyces sp. Mi166|nr:hypothetical protein C0995_011419 [Termitomyces sp. Mi166\
MSMIPTPTSITLGAGKPVEYRLSTTTQLTEPLLKARRRSSLLMACSFYLVKETTSSSISASGSLIEVFGTIGLENNGNASFAATSSYTIDDNFNSTVQFTGQIGTVTLYQQLFFVSQGLAERQHTLVISYKTPGKNPLWLDYLRVTRSLSTSTITPSSSSLSTGAIVGIAVGGCAALVLLVIIFYLLYTLFWSQSNIDTHMGQVHIPWWQRLWTRREPKPPAELHPFDSYPRVSQYSQSQSSVPSSRGMDIIYYREANGRSGSRGSKPNEKRKSGRSNLTNVVHAQGPPSG